MPRRTARNVEGPARSAVARGMQASTMTRWHVPSGHPPRRSLPSFSRPCSPIRPTTRPAACSATRCSTGDPRGEFIAVQLALANKAPAKAKALWDRFRKLHSAHAAKWAKPLRALGKGARWGFHRGSVRQLRLEYAGPKLSAFAAALAVEPVTHLVLDRVPNAWVIDALAIPGMERLQRLAILSTDVADARHLARKVGTAKLPRLEELRIGLFGTGAVSELAPALQAAPPSTTSPSVAAVTTSR